MIYCSFCARSEQECQYIIASNGGEYVCICDICIDICVDIINEQKNKQTAKDDQPEQEAPSLGVNDADKES